MIEVKKFAAGTHPQEVIPVKSSIVEDLIDFYTESGGNPDDQTRNRAREYLIRLKSYGRWLACGCSTRAPKDAPILYPQGAPGGITLVRNYSRGDHVQTCPFNRLRCTKTEAPSMAPCDPITGFGVLKQDRSSSTLGQSSRIARTGSTTKRMPTLARILFTLFERAELNRIVSTGKKRNVSNDKDALKIVLNGFFFDESRKIPASSFTKTSFNQLDQLKQLLAAERNERWPTNLMPQGLLIDQLEDFEIDVSTGEKWLHPFYCDKISVEGTLTCPGAATTGPYIAIALLATMPGQNEVSIARAYVHPVFGVDELIPIDSGLERDTLSILKRKQWQLQKLGRPFEIVKPLLDISLQEGVKVRPDFILERNGKSCVVETMGYRDDAYCARKVRTHAQMTKIGSVVKHEPNEDGAFKRELAERLEEFETTVF